MTLLSAALVWLALLGLLLLEFVLAYMPSVRSAVPFIGLTMAALVALTFMRLGKGRGLVPVFAVAGMFWLCVLLGLGTLDPFTRHDIPVGTLTGSDSLAGLNR